LKIRSMLMRARNPESGSIVCERDDR
jgi:hypothetical protein